MPEHKDATQIHKGRYIQTSDPGAVGAGVEWLDTTTTPPVHKKRNSGNTDWDVILDQQDVALKSGHLGQFAATTSAQLRGVLSDETGTGAAVFADSPALAGTPTAPTASAGTNTTQVATTAFVRSAVDAGLAGLSWKQSVRAATTGAGTLASSFENGDTVDGVTLVTGDRILIKNQAAGEENGIYTVNASGAPTRATDADTATEIRQASVYVEEGTTNADTQWVCTTNTPITLGSTALAFAQLTSGGASALDDLSDVVITSPSSGEVLTYNGSEWVNDTGASSNTVFGPARSTGDVPVNGDFSWLNQGSATISVSARDGSLFLKCPLHNSDSCKIRKKAAPSTPYTIIAAFEAVLPSLDFPNYGLVFRDSGADKITICGIICISGEPYVAIARSSGQYDTSGGTYTTVKLITVPKFLAIRDDGTTNRKYYIGAAEEDMWEIFSHGRTTDITPDEVGFYTNPRNASYPMDVNLLSWREQSGAP